MRIILALLAVSLSFLCSSQSQNIFKYFDEKWQEVSDPNVAFYYRTVEEISGIYLVTDYYASTHSKEMESVCIEIFPELIRDGESKWYYANGRVKKEGFFKENNRDGIFKTYYESGSLHSIIHYYSDSKTKPKYIQVWTGDGAPLLHSGTGLIAKDHTIDNYDFMDIEDSLLVAAYSVRPERADTIYWVAEKPAEFKGGMMAFYEGVAKALVGKYPKEARRKGIQGHVFIEFTIDKYGNMVDEKVVKGIGGGCDELALESFAKLKKWTPATYRGKSVKTILVLPVVFKLN